MLLSVPQQQQSLEFKANQRLENIVFTDNVISLIIENVKVHKAHGWDNISIGIIKLRDESTALPLRLILQSFLNDGVFPED